MAQTVNMTRPAFKTRIVRLIGQAQKDIAKAIIDNAPVDTEKPLEVVIREERKTRKPDQSSAMWAGILREIAEQAWVEGRRYPAETWHFYLKREYLPELDDPDIDVLVREGYRKWDIDPKGERVLIGSTTQLTVKGMARYMQEIEAYGAGLGVVFHAPPVKWESESARHT